MRKLLCLIPFLALGLAGCGDSGPRDATNDPEVQAMLKHVNEEGKPMGAPAGAPGAAAGTPSGAPSGAPAGGPAGAPGGTPGGTGSASGG